MNNCILSMALNKLSIIYFFTVIYFVVVPVLVFGVATNLAEVQNIGLLLVCLFFIGFFIFSLWLGDEYALLTLLITMAIQPLVSAIFAEYSSSIYIKASIALKDIMAIILFLSLLFRQSGRGSFSITDYFAITFLLLVLTSFIASDAGLFLKLLSLREVLSILIYFYIGVFITHHYMPMMSFYHGLLIFMLSFLLFSLSERFLFDAETWNWFNALSYLNKKFEVGLINGFPLNWYTYITETQIERRIVGPILEPTSFSRYLSVITIFIISVLITKKDNYYFKIAAAFVAIIGVGVLLIANTRGGVLIFITYIFASAFYYLNKPMKLFFVFIGIPLILIIIEKYSLLLSLDSGSAARHLTGLFAGFEHANPFGYGLGSSGQVAFSYGAESVAVKVTESFIGSLVYQAGYYSVILLSLFFFSIIFRIHFSGLDNQWKAAGISVAVGIFITSFLSNSAVSPTSAGFGMVVCGILCSSKSYKAWGER